MKKEIKQITQYWGEISIESLKTAWGKIRDDVKGILKLAILLIIALLLVGGFYGILVLLLLNQKSRL